MGNRFTVRIRASGLTSWEIVMEKDCKHCGVKKTLAEFFSASFDGRAHEIGTSMFCKQCHAEGRIKHGYGDFGEKFKTPESTC